MPARLRAHRGTAPRAAIGRPASACFNDCGVAIELLKRAGLERVGYVDIDAHQGRRRVLRFEEDAAVVFADLHEDGRFTCIPHRRLESEAAARRAHQAEHTAAPGADDECFASVWPPRPAHLERFAPGIHHPAVRRESLEAIRSPTCASRRVHGARPASWPGSPTVSVHGRCSPWSGDTTATISPRPGPRS